MIKLFVMDVDGTLTDGKIHISDNGELFKSFDVKDGYAIKSLQSTNCKTCIITSRLSNMVAFRSNELSINIVKQGCSSKLETLKQIAMELKIEKENIAYIGDDLNDIECIEFSRFSACPHDAVDRVKSVAQYVCHNNGGSGAVREFVEHLMSIGELDNIYDL